MKYLSIVFIFAFQISCTSQPKSVLPTENQTKADPNIEKKSLLEKKIDQIKDDFNLPSVHAAIYDRQETFFDYSKGVRAVEHKDTPIAVNDKYFLGTQTKLVTSLLIALMIDQKLLSWEDNLERLLPKEMHINAKLKNVTIEMLLAQRSGLIEMSKLKIWPTLNNGKYSPKRTRELLVESILSYDPQFQPNTKMSANSSNHVVLGYILEKLTNFSWEELVKNKIFSEVGSSQCVFGLPGSPKLTPPDQPYGHTLNKFEVVSVNPASASDIPRAAYPAQSLSCSPHEWSLLLREVNLGLYGQTTFLREETFQKLFGPSADAKISLSSALLFDRIWAGGKTLTFSSVDNLFISHAVLAPSREMILMVFINSGTPKAQEAASKILKLLTEAVQK